MDLSPKDKSFLKEQILSGKVVLFLGAGVNGGATNGKKAPIKTGGELAALLKDKLNLSEEDSDLDLGDLIEEYTSQGGDAGLHTLLRDEFSDCTSSAHQNSLLSYAWLRIYTLNIDDALDHVPRALRAQRLVQVNRMDPVEELRNFDLLEIVHLNGYIKNLDKGIVFTPEQYRSEIRQSSNWYAKCAVDFFDRTFVFLGTCLNEPIFDAHVEELGRNRGPFAARSFLLSPSAISDIKRRRLLQKRIEPVVGTLQSFVGFLREHVGPSLSADAITANISGQATVAPGASALAASVEQIGTSEWASKRRLNDSRTRKYARDFFNGTSPTWEVISNNISVELSYDKKLLHEIQNFAQSQSRLFVVLGQSGSGKTTSLMKAAVALAANSNTKVFALDEGTRESLEKIVRYLTGMADGKTIILFINNLVLFSDELPDLDFLSPGAGVQLIAQCRSRDWEGRVSRYAPSDTHAFHLPKLEDADFEKLRKGIIEHAVAPQFIAMNSPPKQIAFLKESSKRQLLILMKEATHQRKFEEIIEDEYNSIASAAGRVTFCIVGLATLAKNQISVGELREMLGLVDSSLDLNEALKQLDEIVIKSESGLSGRHEIYVRHILDVVVDAQLLKDVIVGTLKYFTRFGQPVIPKLGKQRGNMFKYLLNSDWLFEIFNRKNKLKMAERVYSSIELEYQLDGHYWLQRGLFYRRRKMYHVAQDCFDKSVDAYPGSLFAKHAWAQQQLINACVSRRRTPQSEREVQRAVKELNEQAQLRNATDQYPLITLSRYHPEVYFRWGDMETAKALGKEYFERLKVFRKSLPRKDKSVEGAWNACLALASTGKWSSPWY
jgi:tetratricopeptide (TPR) repeat protein